jgi:molecular chaperone DnaJ
MGRSDDKQSGRSRGDHAGYYRTLGLEPGASAAQIKAAYRSLAMELHPDRNPGRDTKARFQALGHAYAILSAERKREQYDADSVVREAQGAASESMSGAPPLYAPIYCSRCQAVSAQPRYRVFYTVYGWLWGADRKASQGVFCGRCEFRVGVRATATSLITGWWSLTGPSRTCQAVYANFRGGDFEYQNARLMGCQSMYFAHTGKIELALAVAAQAMDLVRSAPANSPDNPVGNYPGNSAGDSAGDSADNLSGLAQSLRDLMDAYAGRSKRTFLKTYRSWSNRRIAAQGLIAVCFALLVASGIGLMFSTSGAADLNAHQTQDPTHSPPRALTFKAPGFILPPSGVFRPVYPNPSGANSSFAIEQSANQASLNIALKLVNPVGSHKWFKLLRASDESEILSLFIRSGDTVEVAVPPGAYRAKVASGQTWQGEEARFGPKTQYATSSAPLQLGIDRERSKSIVVDLAPANVSVKPGDRLFNELDPASF